MAQVEDGSRYRLEKLQELKTAGELPSPKGAALAIMRLTRKDDVSLAELARVVQTDPALVGKLIKTANSAQMGNRRPVVSVDDALVVLGVSTVRNVSLGLSLVSGYDQGRCARFDYRYFWSHSLACAVAAQMLASQVHAAPPGDLFSIGLLSRVGQLALATVFPDRYTQLLAQHATDRRQSLAPIEQASFAVDHVELTAAMLLDWGLPRMFADLILTSTAPDQAELPAESRQYALTWLLALARQIADICLAGEKERRSLMAPLLRLGSKLSLDSDVLIPLCDQVVAGWQEWAKQFSIETRAVPSFAELSEAPSAPELTAEGMPNAAGAKVAWRVLVVDDEASMRALLRTQLELAGYEVSEAANGQKGLEMAVEKEPHILVTDWLMPEMDGVELTRALRKTRMGRGIYIIILTALEAEDKLVEAFDAGVDDFMSKPLRPRVLGARLRAAQRVVMLQQEIEHDREEIHRFATELAITNRRLQEAALTDPLTGFPNRRYAIERFQQEWQTSNRSRRPISCMVVDVDNFKPINDTHGHDVGDAVLKQTALAIKRGLRAQDVVSRIGGDEFLVICPETDLNAALACGERVRRAVSEMQVAAGQAKLAGSVSIGVAARTVQMADIDTLIKAADEGVYLAKHDGRNRVATIQRPPSG